MSLGTAGEGSSDLKDDESSPLGNFSEDGASYSVGDNSEDGASYSVGDKSTAEFSDEQNTSLLSAIKTDESDAVRLRRYRERKIRKLVDKCRLKNIRFPYKFVRISSKLATNIASCTDAELIELTTECIQSLGSDNETGGESSSSDSSSEPVRKKTRVKKSLLTPTPKRFDRTNPYNSAWFDNSATHSYSCQTRRPRDVYMASTMRFPHPITPQEQHEIFHAQVYGNTSQPSLEMSTNYGFHNMNQCGFINTPRNKLIYDVQHRKMETTGDIYMHPQVPQVTTGDVENNSSESGGASMLNLSVPLLSSTPRSTQDDLSHPDEDNAEKVTEVNT